MSLQLALVSASVMDFQSASGLIRYKSITDHVNYCALKEVSGFI